MLIRLSEGVTEVEIEIVQEVDVEVEVDKLLTRLTSLAHAFVRVWHSSVVVALQSLYVLLLSVCVSVFISRPTRAFIMTSLTLSKSLSISVRHSPTCSSVSTRC